MTRPRLTKLLLAAACAAMLGAPLALAQHHDGWERVVETVHVPARYETVEQRVYVPGSVETIVERVWIPERFTQVYEIVHLPCGGTTGRWIRQRVPGTGRWAHQPRTIRHPGRYEIRLVRRLVPGTGVDRRTVRWVRRHRPRPRPRPRPQPTPTTCQACAQGTCNACQQASCDPEPGAFARIAVGVGRPPAHARSAAQARLMALRAARVDALRRLGGRPGAREISSRVFPDGSARVVLTLD